MGALALDVDCQKMSMCAPYTYSPRGKRTGDVCTIKPKLTRGGSVGGHGHIVGSFREAIFGVQRTLTRGEELGGTVDGYRIRAAGIAEERDAGAFKFYSSWTVVTGSVKIANSPWNRRSNRAPGKAVTWYDMPTPSFPPALLNPPEPEYQGCQPVFVQSPTPPSPAVPR